MAELASGTYEELGWPELLPFIFQCVQSNDTRLQESSLLVFAQLARHIMGTLRQYMGTLHEVFTRTLTSSSQDVALAAMRATSNFVQVRSRKLLQRCAVQYAAEMLIEGPSQKALSLFRPWRMGLRNICILPGPENAPNENCGRERPFRRVCMGCRSLTIQWSGTSSRARSRRNWR